MEPDTRDLLWDDSDILLACDYWINSNTQRNSNQATSSVRINLRFKLSFALIPKLTFNDFRNFDKLCLFILRSFKPKLAQVVFVIEDHFETRKAIDLLMLVRPILFYYSCAV